MELGFAERGACWALPRWLVSPRPGCRAPAAAASTPAHSGRQDSLALVVMVTAAPVNERLSDTCTPVRPEVVRSAPRSRLPETPLRGVLPARVAVRFQAKVGFQGFGLFLSWTAERCLENKRNGTARTLDSLGARRGAWHLVKAQREKKNFNK